MGVPQQATMMTDREDIDIDLREIDERILDQLEAMPSTRQHLATQLDVTGEYVYQRVDLLIKLGVVERIHDGFYRLAESEVGTQEQPVADRRRQHEREPVNEDVVKDAVETHESEKESAAESVDASAIALPENMPQKIDEDEAREAIAAVIAMIRKEGSASQLEITKTIMPDWPLTYDVDDALDRLRDPDQRNRTTWWRNAIQPALKAHPAIEKPDSSGQRWEWVGD